MLNVTNMKAKTLYATLRDNLRKQGYEVEEGSWIESVGYKKSTTEYWLDVTLKTKDNIKYVSHYWFKDNLNEIKELQFWKITYKVVEDKTERIA